MPFRYSQDQFAVVCTAFDVHFAEIVSTDHSIKLHPLIVGSERPGVLVESNRQLFSVSYLGQNAYEKYSYHSAAPEILSLPSNVLCLEGDSATYPLHGQEMFLLQCVTDDGPTLYIVPLDQDEIARAVPSQGRPYSSLDGTYISMVNGSRVVSFPAANQSVLSSTDRFTSRVVKFEFLNPRVAIVLTQGGGHYVMYLSHGVSEITQLPGGLPVKWVWIDPHNYYLYVTDQNELFLFNDTLKDPEDMPKSVVGRPELLLFARKYVPDPVLKPTNNSGLSDKDPSGPNSVPAILGGIFGGTILTAVAAAVAVFVFWLKCWKTQPPHSGPPYLPVQESTTRGTAMTTLKSTVEEGSNGKGGDQYEIPFSQPADEPHAVENWSDSAGNVATATDDAKEHQNKNGSKGKGDDQYEISFSQRADEPHAAKNWNYSAKTIATATATDDAKERQNKKGDVTERDIANFLPVTQAEQVTCPPGVPNLSVEAGKASTAAPSTGKAKPPSTGQSSSTAVKPPSSAVAAVSPLTAGHGPDDFYAFRENPSCTRNTSTAVSAFVPGEEETIFLHAGSLAN